MRVGVRVRRECEGGSVRVGRVECEDGEERVGSVRMGRREWGV